MHVYTLRRSLGRSLVNLGYRGVGSLSGARTRERESVTRKKSVALMNWKRKEGRERDDRRDRDRGNEMKSSPSRSRRVFLLAFPAAPSLSLPRSLLPISSFSESFSPFFFFFFFTSGLPARPPSCLPACLPACLPSCAAEVASGTPKSISPSPPPPPRQ